MSGLNWELIKGGFSGFEKLAVEYVRSEHKSYPGWKSTSQTRDGNKDAVSVIDVYPTIIMGYQPDADAQEEWWMEAKYSLRSEKLTRYKLDATIVSAIIKGNVTKIVFVTNINVNSKTIIDIRNALGNSTTCQEVAFCTKSTLEYWLIKNPDMLQKYFGKSQSRKLIPDDLFIIENIDFYSDPCKHLTFSEPLKVLDTGKSYLACFAIFSSMDRSAKISLDKDIASDLSLGTSHISLKKGENNIMLSIHVRDDIKQEKSINGVFFKIDNKLDCMLKMNITLIPTYSIPLQLHSQRVIVERIEARFAEFSRRPGVEVHSIIGGIGLGKTYVLDAVTRTLSSKKSDMLYLSFSQNSIRNYRLLVDLVLFALFPFIPPTEIDAAYLYQLKDTNKLYLGNGLINIVTYRDEPDRLVKLIEEYVSSSEQKLLPLFSSVNIRVVIIDDLHKLSDLGARFLFTLIHEFSECNSRIFAVLGGRNACFESEDYLKLPTRTEYFCKLLTKELLESVDKDIQLSDYLNENIVNILFPSAIDFLIFLDFIRDFGEKITNVGKLIWLFKSFKENNMTKEYILEAFERAFSGNDESKKWCDQIYRSPNGLNVDSEPNECIKHLLVEHLIRYNSEGRIVPYHDMYVEVYTKHYSKARSSLQTQYADKYEEMQHVITFNNNTQKLAKTVEDILQLKNSEQYYAIIYILEPVFEGSDNYLKDLLPAAKYYKLYYVYAYAVANQSKKISGNSVFGKIYEEIRGHSNLDVTIICTDVISELINSKYESLFFTEAEKLIGELIGKLENLIKFNYLAGPIEQLDSYILGRSIQVLIVSEKKELNADNEFKKLDNILSASAQSGYARVSNRFRYARTLYARDLTQSQELIDSCLEMLSELPGDHAKLSGLLTFESTLLKLIAGDISLMADLLRCHEKLKKNFYNDYRKGIFVLIAILYAHGEIDQGNTYLFSDIMVARKFRPRQEGFYYQTLAFHEIISKNNKSNALEALSKARNIFVALEEYNSIITHNIDVITHDRFSPDRICFYSGMDMEEDKYYIDPRCSW